MQAVSSFLKKYWLSLSFISLFYFATHLPALTKLPVFADEAIYIRWTQLIIDDWRQYLFFPLNDGKTPLQMWLGVPFQLVFSDQLFAGRFLVVLVGFLQVLVSGLVTKALGGKRTAITTAMILTSILPFWYFHHRMALLDGLLTLFASLSVWGVINITREVAKQKGTKKNILVHLLTATLSFKQYKKVWTWSILTGIFFGLGLWTKIPIILFAPGLFLFTLLPQERNWQKWMTSLAFIGGSLLIGLVVFYSLKIHPAFSQLFSRGSDFLFPWREVVFDGKWRQTLISIPNYFVYFATYLSLPVLLLNIYGLFTKNKVRIHVLFWAGLLFILPVAVLGIVVYPRYLFPASFFFTIAASLVIGDIFKVYEKQAKNMAKRTATAIIFALLLANIAVVSAEYMFYSLTNPDMTPFVSSDQSQYLHEWSSGHGIKETVEYIQDQAQSGRVAVATEGHFGTLPDGILIYLHRRDVSNIYVDGIGFPITDIPDSFIEKAGQADQYLLVVNSHRMTIPPDNMELVNEYCRPNNAPCLQVWDISQLVQQRAGDNQNP